jgi:hypothetical protein
MMLLSFHFFQMSTEHGGHLIWSWKSLPQNKSALWTLFLLYMCDLYSYDVDVCGVHCTVPVLDSSKRPISWTETKWDIFCFVMCAGNENTHQTSSME